MSESSTPSSGTYKKRRPIPRKGHTKSRGGCLNCKRRKVKCNETTPECAQCIRLKLDCIYDNSQHRAVTCSALAPTRALSTDPSWFSISDMRFFQHFLFSAYPSLPLDGWEVWQDVSQMSHEYDFLVHAMLGLGASHLTLLTDEDYSTAAINHRIVALHGLNEFLANADKSIHTADAAFAASLVLAFQSTQLKDGLNDFLTMVRGCHLVGYNLLGNFDDSRFRTFEREIYINYLHQMIPKDSAFPCFGPDSAQGFCDSVKRIGSLCRSVQDLEYIALMQRIVTQALTDPVRGHDEHTKLYDKLGSFSAEEFTTFIDPQNAPAQLIIMHILVLDYVMGSTVIEGRMDNMVGARLRNIRHVFDYRKGMLLQWTKSIEEGLPKEFKKYARWTLDFAAECVKTGTTPNRIHNGAFLKWKETGEQ